MAGKPRVASIKNKMIIKNKMNAESDSIKNKMRILILFFVSGLYLNAFWSESFEMSGFFE